MTMQLEWSADHIRVLREMFHEGRHGSEIASELGRSRDSVIGKLRRLGLKRGKSQPVKRKETRFSLASTVNPTDNGSRRAPYVPKADEEQPERLSCLFDLEANSCRWPFGDPRQPDFGFCGADRKPGSSYCRTHHAVAYKQADEDVEAA